VPNAVALLALASVAPLDELPPIATAPAADAVVLLLPKVTEPIAIEVPPVDDPPPAAYCACARLLAPTPINSTADATAFATDDLFGLPRADEISDTATQAPRTSFQIVLYVLFI
jgi:hypothetical protein